MKAQEYMYTIRENFDQYGIKLHQDGCNIVFDFPNPYHRENLSVSFDKEQVTMRLGQYHAHYRYDKEDFDELQGALQGILENRYAVLHCLDQDRSLCWALCDMTDGPYSITEFCDALRLNELTDDLTHISVQILFWNPASNQILK